MNNFLLLSFVQSSFMSMPPWSMYHVTSFIHMTTYCTYFKKSWTDDQKKNSKHLKFHWNLSSLKIGKQKWKPWPELLLSLFTSFCVVVVPLIFSFSCMAEVWSHFMDFVFPSKNSTSWITLVGKWVTSRGVFSTKC